MTSAGSTAGASIGGGSGLADGMGVSDGAGAAGSGLIGGTSLGEALGGELGTAGVATGDGDGAATGGTLSGGVAPARIARPVIRPAGSARGARPSTRHVSSARGRNGTVTRPPAVKSIRSPAWAMASWYCTVGTRPPAGVSRGAAADIDAGAATGARPASSPATRTSALRLVVRAWPGRRRVIDTKLLNGQRRFDRSESAAR